MGTTLNSLHIYSNETISSTYGSFRSFSIGWQTWLSENESLFNENLRTKAKILSKSITAPVLLFEIYDSDEIILEIYVSGKRAVHINTFLFWQSKGMFKVPALIGYPQSGFKNRLSQIFSCPDAEDLTEMLEEYLGVCLLVFPELVNETPDLLQRVRKDDKYKSYMKEISKTKGKYAPIQVKLISTIPGKVFKKRFGEWNEELYYGYYYYGYGTPEHKEDGNYLQTVKFEKGNLIPVEEANIPRVPFSVDKFRHFEITEHYPRTEVKFSDTAPINYRGRSMVMPSGYFPFDFNTQNQLLVSNLRNSIALLSEEGSIIAKCSVMGCPDAYSEDYLLTSGNLSHYAFGYDPNELLRIYKIENSTNT